MKHFTCLILILLAGSGLHILPAQTSDSALVREGLFDDHDLLNITVTAEMRTVLRDVGDERDYHPATFSYEDGGRTETLEVELRTRGNFRRQRSICNMPPIRVRFDEEKSKGTLFHHQKKLKLVTVCQYKRDSYQQNLFLEYLTYRSYNTLTDSSFRVRLAKITFADSRGKLDTFVRYSFFIESEAQLADRLGGRLIKIKNVHPKQTFAGICVQMNLFQFMIGNTDWSIPNLHNIRLVGRNGAEPPVPIPYDFDWSGMINAPYAKPNPKLGLRAVTDRLYRGFCRPQVEIDQAVQRFLVAKESIFALYESCEMLDERTRKRATDYLQEFYEILENEKAFEREILNACRTDK